MSDVDYEASYEYDPGYGFTGDILAYNLHGHGLDLDDIEGFLRDRYDDNEIEAGGWEVREDWMRKVPTPSGDFAHHYGKPGRGARAVTVLEQPSQWGRWCVNHAYEPASAGRHVSEVADGEQLVARRLAVIAAEIDPRPDVDERGYVYLCRECADSFSERLKVARAAAMEANREDDLR